MSNPTQSKKINRLELVSNQDKVKLLGKLITYLQSLGFKDENQFEAIKGMLNLIVNEWYDNVTIGEAEYLDKMNFLIMTNRDYINQEMKTMIDKYKDCDQSV
jgi:hypothetical protein